MALSFLHKKIWHPGSFANMEKTWVTEQKYREVERRAIEKAKKIKEEKVYEEMKKIQVEKGLIPAYHLHRLDFMYQCPQPEKTDNKDETEDFLLGKRLDDNEENIYMKRKKKIVPKFANTYANPQNEEFVRIHEDPLYLILKEEKKQRTEIEQNPYKMKMILNEIKDSRKEKSPFNDKKQLLYEKKKNDVIKLKEDDEYKRSQSLRRKEIDSDEETEKYYEKEFRREREKEKHKHNHRDKYDKYDNKSNKKYTEDRSRNRHDHHHKHRHKSKDRKKYY